jgi:nucleoside phosphorylase
MAIERASARNVEVADPLEFGTCGFTRCTGCACRAIGPTGSTRQAHFYLAATEAQGIVCLGMAFGISRAHQGVGTVLVSDSLFPYDVRDVIADGCGSFMLTSDESSFDHLTNFSFGRRDASGLGTTRSA